MKQLQEMFDALLPTNEQEERMLCEILVARNGKPKRRSRNNPVRVAVLIAAVLALCVVTASAAEILGVSQMIRDYFQQKDEVSVMDKLNVAAKGLNTTTADGWKITITDLFGDDNRWLMGVTVEAPAGTVLDRNDYSLYMYTEGTPSTMPEEIRQEEAQRLKDDGVELTMEDRGYAYLNYLQHNYWIANQISDDNPKDNKASFIFDEKSTFYKDGITLDFIFDRMSWHEPVGYDSVSPGQDPHVRKEERIVKQFDSTIRGVATHFSTNGYHLTPNTAIKAFSGDAVVSKLTFTPLSISFEVTGDSVNKTFFDVIGAQNRIEIKKKMRPTHKERYTRWWESRFTDATDAATKELAKHPDQWDDDMWYSWPWELDTPLVLHFKDGSSQEVDIFDKKHASENSDTERKALCSIYRFETPLDLDAVDYITICDARISLSAEAVK